METLKQNQRPNKFYFERIIVLLTITMPNNWEDEECYHVIEIITESHLHFYVAMILINT